MWGSPCRNAGTQWILFILLIHVAPELSWASSHLRHNNAAKDTRQTPLPLLQQACHSPGHAALGLTEELFPNCAVLEAGEATLYWRPPLDANSSTAATGNITFGLLLKDHQHYDDDNTTKAAAVTTEKHYYYALGLNPESRGMKGLDVTMLMQAGAASDPTWVLEDRFAEDYATPALTTSPPPAQKQQQQQQQHQQQQQQPPPKKTLLSVQTRPAEQALSFTFSMPLSACIIPRSRPTYVLWAQGSVNPPTATGAGAPGAAAEPQHHGPHKGSTSISLRSSPSEWQASQAEQRAALSMPAPALKFTVALPLMDVPEVETRYMCMYVAPPQKEKYHIYRVLRKGKEEVARAYVHHMFLYNAGNDEPSTPVNQPFECTADGGNGLPFYTENAGRPSSPPDELYEEVGAALPFGKGYDKYWMLQVHFNNQEGVKGVQDTIGVEVHFNNQEGFTGVQDTTGVDIHYSPTLRQHDIGILVLGAPPPSIALRLNSSLIIPPSRPAFDYLNYCPSSCTAKHIAVAGTEGEGGKEGGVKTQHVIYAYIHMHLLAKEGEIQLLRNTTTAATTTIATAGAAAGGVSATIAKEGGREGWGVERFEILHRKRWDARNQEGVTFPTPGFALQSDDAFLTRCRYDSSNQKEETHYGPRIKDEMCLALLFYYPAQKLGSTSLTCMDLDDASSPDINFFGANNKSKPENFAICQPAHITANISSHPKAAGLLAFTEGSVSFSRKEMEEAKVGFSRREGEEDCA